MFKAKNQHLTLTEEISLCFHKIYKWVSQYFLQINTGKTQIIVCCPPSVLSEIEIGGILIGNIVIRFILCIINKIYTKTLLSQGQQLLWIHGRSKMKEKKTFGRHVA